MKTKGIAKPKVVTFENLTVKIIKGKFGEYMYRSPFFGYKRAYRYDKVAYIYLDGRLLDRLHFKRTTNKEIIDSLENYKNTSISYKRAMGIPLLPVRV